MALTYNTFCNDNNLTCLTDSVGIRLCGDTDDCQYKKLYIDDLPGFSVEHLSQFISNGENSISGFVDKVKLQCAKELINEVVLLINKAYNINIVSTPTPLRQSTNFATGTGYHYILAGAVQRGVNVHLNRNCLDEHTIHRLFIKSVSVATKLPVNFVFKVADADTVTTYSLDTVGGGRWSKVNIDFTASTDDIYVYYDGSQCDVLSSIKNRGCGNCSGTKCGKIDFIPFTSLGSVPSSINKNGQNTYGLNIEAVTKCDTSNILCGISDSLSLPLLYKTAIALQKHFYASARLGSVNIDKDVYSELLSDLQSSYEMNLKSSVSGIYRYMCDLDRCCISFSGSKMLNQII